MSLEKKNRKKSYFFKHETKELAIKKAKYKCECCGSKFNENDCQKAELHHLLPIWAIYKNCPEMSAEIIRSLANAVVLCHDCHSLLHKKEKKLKNYYGELIKELESLDEFLLNTNLSPKLKQFVFLASRNKRQSMLNILKKEIK